MPNRLIREGFLDSEAVNSLDPFTECIYHRLLIVSDDAGRFDGRALIIASRCYPLKDSIRAKDVDGHLLALERARLIIRYEWSKKPFIQVTKWQKCGKSTTSKFPWRDGSFQFNYTKAGTRDGIKEFVTSSLLGNNPATTPSLPHADGVMDKNQESNTETETETETIYGVGVVGVDDTATTTTPIGDELGKLRNESGREGLPEYPPDCPFKDIVESYNQTLGSKLKLVQIPTDARKSAIVEFWRLLECDISNVRNYWQKVRKSDYLLGKKSTRGPWRGSSFDWLINTENAVKVIEGNYDNEGRN